MSHFSKVKTKICDLDALAQALQELGYTEIQTSLNNDLVAVGVGSRAANVSLIATGHFFYNNNTESTYPRGIGFTAEADGTFSMVFDPYMLNLNDPYFVQHLQAKIYQKYAAVVAKNQLIAQGFNVAEEVTEDGEIHMTLVRIS